MAFKTQFVPISCDGGTEVVKDVVKAEARTTVNIENVDKVIDVKARTVITGSEVSTGQVRYSGRTIFCVLYEDTEGQLKKTECGAEFSGSIGKAEEGSCCYVTADCLKAYVERAGVLIARADVQITAYIYGKKQFNVLMGGDIITKNQDVAQPVRKFSKKTTVNIDEEFELNYGVKEVLYSRCDVAVISVSSGNGTLIVDGEAYLSLLLLQKIENSDILKERRIIPFRIEVDSVDAMPSEICAANAVVKNSKIDIVVDEETGKSNVTFRADVEAEGYVTEIKSISPVVDCYSLEKEVNLEFSEMTFACPCGQKTVEERFNERAVFDTPIEAGARLMTADCDSVEVVKQQVLNGKLVIDAVVNAVCYLKNLDGRTEVRKYAFPLSFTLDGEEIAVYLLVTVSDFYGKIVSLNEIESGGTVKITYRTEKINIIKCICGIEEGEDKKSGYALSVYIPERGEDLWSVSKRLNSSPEKLSRLNPDLEFPLCGEERIVVFRQKRRDF